MCLQVPPLYLRITSTTKEGLDAAVAMIEELMKQDLPNLVDERRFRRREPENFERDELGRVRARVPIQMKTLTFHSASGPSTSFLSTSNPSTVSTSERRW